jgi:hypothetical protein
VAAEQVSGSARLPHDRGVDDGVGLDRLERVHLHVLVDDGVLADEALVTEDDTLLAPRALAQIAAPTDDRAPEADAGVEVGVVVDDRPLEVGLGADHHVAPEDRVLPDVGAGLDLAVVTDHGGADDLGRRIDLRALAEPHAVAHLEALDADLDLPVEDVLVGLVVGLERADVLPVAVGHVPEQRLGVVEQLREDLAREVDAGAFLDVVEDRRFEDVDAGVDRVAEHLAPAGLLEEPLDAPVLVRDDDPELEGVLHRLEADRRHRAPLLVELHDGGQVDVGEDVAGDHEEPLVLELLHGVADRARRAEGGLLGGVDHADAELRAVAEVVADRVGQEGDGDDDVLEPVLLQELDDVLHHRPVGDGHHRLRLVRRQRAEAGALATRHDHGFHGVSPTPRSRRACRAIGT